MKLIESSVEILEQEPGLEGIYKMAELAGRTAYKSEDKITEGSAKRFVDAIMKSNHGAVLEHGTVYMVLKWWQIGRKLKYLFNPYSKIRKFKYVTSNLRVLFEHNWMNDLNYLCEPTKYHEKRVTAKFICSRGVSHEAVRHRAMSFLMESQRYVAYNRDKFGGEITYVIPEWVKTIMTDIASSIDWVTRQTQDYILQMPMTETVEFHGPALSRAVNCWIESMKRSEDDYMYLITEEELKAEEARSVLPNDCKTELVMTGFVSDWNHFFDLRSRGTTGKPHPDIKILADNLLFQFNQNNLL